MVLLRSSLRNQPRSPIRLKNVTVEFDKRFGYDMGEDGDGEVADYFTAVQCLGATEELFPYFVEMMVAMADSLSAPLAEAEVDKTVASLVELFKQAKGPKQSTIAGLWGELLVISAAPEPSAYVKAWHLEPSDTFDFAFDSHRVEVKATEKQLREHEFSLGQVGESREGDFVASVLLKRSAAGLSIRELAERIHLRLNPEDGAKFWSLIFQSLEEDALLTDDVRYDLIYSKSNLRFVSSSYVPRPRIEGDGLGIISHVRFRVNIGKIAEDMGFTSIPELAV